MYGIDGQKILTEKTLHHLSGYKNSKPVRVGNAAYSQKQNDITEEEGSTLPSLNIISIIFVVIIISSRKR